MSDEMLTFDEIAVGLAHDMKNPLSLVRAGIELLELSDEGQNAKYYQMVRRELIRIGDMIDDLAALSPPDPEKFTEVSLKEMVNEVTGPYEALFEELEFSVNIPDIKVLGDRRNLIRCVENIIKNGAEAMGFNGRFQISTVIIGDTVSISFTDSGPGFSDEAIKPGLSSKAGGWGIGLYTVRKIVCGHNGTLSVGNNNGGMVTISLPILS